MIPPPIAGWKLFLNRQISLNTFLLLCVMLYLPIDSIAQPISEHPLREQTAKTIKRLCFNQTPFRVALHELFKQAGVPYRVDSEAEQFLASDNGLYDSKITLDLQDVSFPLALHRLMHYTNGTDRPISRLQNRESRGIYLFSMGEGLREEKVTLHLDDIDLLSALKQGCAQIDANYAFDIGDLATHKLTLSVQDMPFGEAIAHILKAAHCDSERKLRVIDGMAVVGRLIREVDEPLRDVQGFILQEVEEFVPHPLDKYYLHVAHENLYSVLRAVCYARGGNFTLDPITRLSSVDKTLENVTFDQAVKTLMRTSKIQLQLTYDTDIPQIKERHGPRMVRGSNKRIR